jgi:hypothetical protein
MNLKWIKISIVNLLVLFVLLLIIEKIFLKNVNAGIELNNDRHINLREHKQNTTQIFDNKYQSTRYKSAVFKEKNAITTDSEGFIVGPNIIKDYDKLIFFSGGSTTQCIYVDEDKRFPYLVQENLNGVGYNVKTVNSGVGGSNSFHGYLSFITKGMRLSPDILFVMYNINDIALLSKTGSYFNAPSNRKLIIDKKNIENHPYFDRFLGFLRRVKNILYPKLWKLFRENVLGFKVFSVTTDEFKNHRVQNPSNSEILSKYKNSILNFVSFCKNNNIRLILLSQFNMIENKSEIFIQDYNQYKQEKEIEEFVDLYKQANELLLEISILNNIEFIDLNKLIPKTDEFIFDTIHLTDKGSILVSKIISNYLSK